MQTDQGATAPISLPTEPTIVIEPDLSLARFIGTRTMLETEGFAPPGGEWPDGYDDVRWQSGQFDFRLMRKRPEDAKGPRRAFADVDWFCLRWELTNQPSWEQLDIERKRRELAESIYRNSAKGRAERDAQWNRYWESTKDKPFQAFKAACGIVEKRRSRPRKSDQGADAT